MKLTFVQEDSGATDDDEEESEDEDDTSCVVCNGLWCNYIQRQQK